MLLTCQKKMLEDEGISLPMVTTLHGTDITLVGSHPFYKRAVQFSINNSEYVTAVSKSLKEDTERLFDVEKPINVIPNFIDLSKTNDTGKTIDKYVVASKDQFVITHISNFRPLKRIIDVLKVFEKIRNKLDAKLIMVGDGPEKLRAKSYCKSHKLDEDVLFLGNSNEVDQILSFSDLFLLPSEQESFGLVALEAMIHKVPVVSTDIGGLPEVIENGYSGYLCPVGDINLMADQAVFILEDSDRHERFKNQALESCKKFDINNIVIHYEELYGKAIKN
jgi:N-acetyl-alpha-D-glucosaminyl L-malate synthase BshA